MLGIQDIQRMVDALTILIDEVSNLSSTAKTPLLELSKKVGAEHDFVAEVFLTAVKCPTVFTRRLSSEMIRHLNSLGWPEQYAPIPNSSDSSEETQEPVSQPEDTSEPVNQEENVPPPAGFSQEAKEVSVSYRRLSIPEDKEAAISYFLSICGNSAINLDYEDVASVLSEAEGFYYSMVELRGTWQSIVFELSRWEKMPNCMGCIIELELFEDTGLDTTNGITSNIQDLINEDANLILGVKFVSEFPADQVYVLAIFQIQGVPPEIPPTEKGSSPDAEKSHKATEGEPDEDWFDDIFKIFNKKS